MRVDSPRRSGLLLENEKGIAKVRRLLFGHDRDDVDVLFR